MRDEILAGRIYKTAGIPEDTELGVGDIAVALLGPFCIEYDERLRRPVALRSSPCRIVLRCDLPRDELAYAIASGVVEWWALAHPGALRDCSASAVAAYLVVPTGALRASLERHGSDFGAIAREFVCSVALIERRIGEVRARPSSNIRIRRNAS